MVKQEKVVFTTVIVACALAALIAGSSSAENTNQASHVPSTDAILFGMVRTSNGKGLEGVAVSARNVKETFTTSVYTDEDGKYFLPVMHEGSYRVWVQAVGFEKSRIILDINPTKWKHQNFTLNSTDDYAKQMSGAEWVSALPSNTPENRRMKEIFQGNCTGCHPANFSLLTPFNETGWRVIIQAMETAQTEGYWSKQPHANIHHYKDDLAAYLAKMRGPGPSPMKFQPLPRPNGEAARVLVTEYDIPPGSMPEAVENGTDWSDGVPSSFLNRGIHDVSVDFNGNAWMAFSAANTNRTYVKLDTKTGKTTDFKVPGKDGYVQRSHALAVDTNGTVWMNFYLADELDKRVGVDESLARLDPSTGKLDMFKPPQGMPSVGNFVGTDPKGNVWVSTTHGGSLRFDPGTRQFREFRSINYPGGTTYDVVGDIDGNGWWAVISHDRLGRSDIETGEAHEISLRQRVGWKDVATEEDLKWYDSGNAGMHENNIGPPWAQTPRRLAADPTDPYVWVANMFGQNVAKVNIRTNEVSYYDVPIPYSNPYQPAVDNDHMVWVVLWHADRVGKFNPKTGKWTVYNLPTLGVEARNISIDRRTGDVWLPSWRTSKVIRMQFRTEQELSVLKSNFAAVSQTTQATSTNSNKEAEKPEKEGQQLYFQRCSICHLGVPYEYETYRRRAPILGQDYIAARGIDKVRAAIMDGSTNMPGFRYGLKPTQVENILAYLKTVKPGDNRRMLEGR